MYKKFIVNSQSTNGIQSINTPFLPRASLKDQYVYARFCTESQSCPHKTNQRVSYRREDFEPSRTLDVGDHGMISF